MDKLPKRTVYVVEDEPLVSLAQQMVLENAGFDVVGAAASVAEALQFLETARPEVVTLDLALRGEIATPVAKRLRELGIPFVVTSAYGANSATFDPIFADAPSLSKPVNDRRLIAKLSDMLAAVPHLAGPIRHTKSQTDSL